MIGTYGSDLSDEQLAHERAAPELPRTMAAFDGPAPATPTHRRRGILTSLMRRQLTDLHTSGTEPIAALHPSEAVIYGRYGYGPATQGARLRCDNRAVRFRPGTDFGDGTIRLLGRPMDLAARRNTETRARRVSRCTTTRAAGRRDTPSTGSSRTRQETTGTRYRSVELANASRQAYAALWRFLAGIDLVSWIEYEGAVDEPLAHLLTDPRAVLSRRSIASGFAWPAVDRAPHGHGVTRGR